MSLLLGSFFIYTSLFWGVDYAAWCAHGMTRKHVEMDEGIRTAQLLNAEGISPSEMASKNDMKYVAMSTEKTETKETSTELKDWRSRDCDKGNRRLYYVALSVGLSIAVNTMLLIGNAKVTDCEPVFARETLPQIV